MWPYTATLAIPDLRLSTFALSRTWIWPTVPLLLAASGSITLSAPLPEFSSLEIRKIYFLEYIDKT